MNWAPAHLPERELRDVYLRPFEAAVREAGLASVMNAYHELDGVPCGANRWLLTDLLRGEWGFDGTVVSDYFAVKQLDDYHHVVGSAERQPRSPLAAGIDVELPSTECYGDVLAIRDRPRCDVDGRRRRGGAPGARVEVAARPVRAAVRRRRRCPGCHTHRRADRAVAADRRREPRAAAQRRHPAAA